MTNEIRDRRIALGVTQRQLSKYSGYTIQTISRIENGKVKPTNVAYRDILRAIGELEDMKVAGLDFPLL